MSLRKKIDFKSAAECKGIHTYTMATITSTTEFVPEIWEQIKEYAGIFPLPANIIHFDKLTFAELEYEIDEFEKLGIYSIYDIFYNKEQFEHSGDKWYYDGDEVKEEEKREVLVRHIKRGYKFLGEFNMNTEEKVEFWGNISKMITEHFEKIKSEKDKAKKRRADTKAYKSTPKGMIAEINKIEDERKRLMKRMKNDKEKLDKLTLKGREWRTKLDNDEVRNSFVE